MNCKTAFKLLYLKPDEMPASAWQKLRAHLVLCEKCRDERRLFEAEEAVLSEIRRESHLDRPAELTNDIMRSVRAAERFARRPSKPVDVLLDVFALRPVRLTFAVCVMLILGVFVAQQIIIVRRFDRLERRLAQTGTAPSTIQVGASADALLALLANQSGQVAIDKKLLEEIVRSYGELQLKDRLLLRLLQERAMRSNISWQDGLNQDELRSLLEDQTIQQKLNEL
ncbi:hypothetical protein JW998_03545 [candidate division KSB1 bacterium]|nr:hypothetical protein [candidate division KSB1 bacterium]